MTKGQKVVDKADDYLWVRETWGRNRSPQIDKWEARWGMRGEPWCGIFVDAMFAEADVSDSGLCHPSVQEICNRANRQGAYWNGKHPIPSGSLWARCGVHTAIIVKDNMDGTVYTVEGNKSDSVSRGRRRISDARIIIPPEVAKDVYIPPVFEYWLEDTKSKLKLLTVKGKVARWRAKASRDKVFAQLVKNNPNNRYVPISRIDKYGKRWYYITVGPVRFYGPWLSKESRKKAKELIEARLGHILREFSRKEGSIRMATDIKVGNGPVTLAGVVFAVTSGLTSLAAFLTTLSGNLPAGVSPTVGVVISAVAGGATTLALAIVATARHFFANLKVAKEANEKYDSDWGWAESADPSLNDIDDVPEEPTDVNVNTPVPVEPI